MTKTLFNTKTNEIIKFYQRGYSFRDIEPTKEYLAANFSHSKTVKYKHYSGGKIVDFATIWVDFEGKEKPDFKVQAEFTDKYTTKILRSCVTLTTDFFKRWYLSGRADDVILFFSLCDFDWSTYPVKARDLYLKAIRKTVGSVYSRTGLEGLKALLLSITNPEKRFVTSLKDEKLELSPEVEAVQYLRDRVADLEGKTTT